MSSLKRNKVYTQEEKFTGINAYWAKGSVLAAAELTGIPRKTLEGWIKSEWGQELLIKIQEETDKRLLARSVATMEQALIQLQDRIQHGDKVIDSKGNESRKPMTGAQLATVYGITFDKAQLQRNRPTSIKANDDIKQLIEAITNYKVIEGEVTKSGNASQALRKAISG